MRLDKLVSEAVGISRTDARKFIAKGQVCVNGAVCKKADTKVEQTTPLTVNGKAAEYVQYVYIMLNKPQGVVSASTDKRDVTVVNLVQKDFGRRSLFPAGRLDKDSTGFVLLTDDGGFAHDILAPKRHVPKTYKVKLDVPVTAQMQAGFEKGVTLADGESLKPAALTPDLDDPYSCTVVLVQGVYHQIKRMFGVFDAGVVALHRTDIGGVALDSTLQPGAYRCLTAREVALLKREKAE
ncbi:MAG: pseudouridine synthase [Oscillospiraceae bacterium]|nr:pseudouridine synthase [Oscillospiraceae bacterium]